MKWTLKVMMGLACYASTALAGDAGEVVNVDARFLFVPQGFDSNDQTQVVVDGYMPNACYKIQTPEVSYNEAERTFTITPKAYKFEADDTVCGTYQVPYTATASLGVLKAGEYTIVAQGTEKRTLPIKQSSTVGPDDFLYAPVDQVYVDVNTNRRQILAYITGRYTNTCMRFQEVKVLDQGETIALLPIIRMENRGDCRETEMSYKGLTAKLPWRAPGSYLLHVRSLSGTAINNVFTVYGE